MVAPKLGPFNTESLFIFAVNKKIIFFFNKKIQERYVVRICQAEARDYSEAQKAY
jgi:hypothetical protein